MTVGAKKAPFILERDGDISFLANKRIAIIPPQVILDIIQRSNFSIPIDSLIVNHSIAYQIELERVLMSKLNADKQIQNTLNTNYTLHIHRIEGKYAYTISIDSLKKILNVDVICFLKVNQRKTYCTFEEYSLFFPNLASSNILVSPIEFSSSLLPKKDVEASLFFYNDDESWIKNTIKYKTNSNLSTNQNINSLLRKLFEKWCK